MSCSVDSTSTVVSIRSLFYEHTGTADCIKETSVAQIYCGLCGVS